VFDVKKKRLKLEVLEQKAAIYTLILLLEKGKMTASELVYFIPHSQGAVYTAKERLEKAGFIEIEEKDKFPKPKIHKLTPKGKAVAEKLLEIEKMLEEWNN